VHREVIDELLVTISDQLVRVLIFQLGCLVLELEVSKNGCPGSTRCVELTSVEVGVEDFLSCGQVGEQGNESYW